MVGMIKVYLLWMIFWAIFVMSNLWYRWVHLCVLSSLSLFTDLFSLPSLGNSKPMKLCSVRGRLRIKITVYRQNSKLPKYLNLTTEDEAIQPVPQYNYSSFFLVDASTTTPINPGLQPENDLPHFLPYYSTVSNVSNSRRSFPASAESKKLSSRLSSLSSSSLS